MTQDDKPSIAELRQDTEALETIAGYLKGYLSGYAPYVEYVERLDAALPILLEIVAAAKEWRKVSRDQHSTAEVILNTQDVLDTALSKVSP